MRRLLMTGAAILVVLLSLGINSAAQEHTRESLESKKKQLLALEFSLAEYKRKSNELDMQLKALAELQAQVQKSIDEQEEDSSELQEKIAIEEEELAFLDSPPRAIVAVSDSDTYLIDFNGTRRTVKMHGLNIDPLKSAEITRALKKRLVKKRVYVRCADTDCNQVYLYISRTGASLNAKLVQAGLAFASGDSKYDVAALLKGMTPSTNILPGPGATVPRGRHASRAGQSLPR